MQTNPRIRIRDEARFFEVNPSVNIYEIIREKIFSKIFSKKHNVISMMMGQIIILSVLWRIMFVIINIGNFHLRVKETLKVDKLEVIEFNYS